MKKIVIASLLCSLAGLATSQQGESHGPAGRHPFTSPHIELPAGAEEISVPFRLVNHHIVLPVTVNGNGPLRIVLDTGMPTENLALHDTEKTKGLRLDFVENAHVKVAGVGGKGKARAVRIAEGLAVGIGDLSMLDMQATLLPPMPGLSSYSDGVIGLALFRHFAVTVDNDRAALILRRPENYRPPDGATVVPLVESMPGPIVEARTHSKT